MEIIHSYERLSELASAQLRRGVCANTVVTRAAYGPAIEQGRLSVLSDPDALLLFQDRGDHVRMNFLMNGFPVLSPGLLPENTVTEIAYRERDTALRESVAYWQSRGFQPLFERIRMSRPAGPAPGGAVSGPVKAPEAGDLRRIDRFLRENFSPLTGCLPLEEELAADLRGGGFLTLEDSGGILGLIHFSLDGPAAEIRHLAIRAGRRGEGLTAPLLDGFLRAAGGRRSAVWVRADALSAQGAYRRFGFQADTHRSAVLHYPGAR